MKLKLVWNQMTCRSGDTYDTDSLPLDSLTGSCWEEQNRNQDTIHTLTPLYNCTRHFNITRHFHSGWSALQRSERRKKKKKKKQKAR